MDKPQNPEAAETDQTTNVPAVDLPRLVRLSDAEKYADPSGPRRMFGCSQERVEEQLRIALDGHPESELWGENGLIAATMRCVEAVGKIEDLVTTDHETKEAFIQRVRGILSLPNNQAQSSAGLTHATCFKSTYG